MPGNNLEEYNKNTEKLYIVKYFYQSKISFF